MTTPDHPDERPARETREREVIVTNGDGRGTNYAGIIVAILAIIVFGVLGYLFIGAMGDGGGSTMPDEVDVNVDPDAGGTDG